MFRSSLFAMLTALAVSGCVSTYAYRDGDGGDYYYADPSVDTYYSNTYYGHDPYFSLGYQYPYGWYGNFGYGYGGYGGHGHRGYGYRYGPFRPHYGHYGYGYGWNGYPYYYYPYSPHRRHHRPHNPPPGVIGGGDRPPPRPGPGPGPGREDRDPDGGPWRHLDRVKPRIMTPQPAIASREPVPGVLVVEPQPEYSAPPRSEPRRPEYRQRIVMPQPQPGVESPQEVYRQPAPAPQPRLEPRRHDDDQSRPAPMRSRGGGRSEMQERETGLDPTP